MTTAPSKLLCPGCGQDLSGRTAMECPSCGARPDRLPKRNREDLAPPRHEIKIPLVAIGVAALGLLLLVATDASGMGAPFLLKWMGVHTAISAFVMLVSRATWLGIVEPWSITAIRLVSVTVVTWLPLTVVLGLPPVFMILYIVPFLTFMIANFTLLELDWQEGLLFGLLTLVTMGGIWAFSIGVTYLEAPAG